MSALVVVGDALLDRDLDGSAERLAPDAPVPVVSGLEPHDRPGGAGLAAALAAAAGLEVTLICALGADRAGARLRELLEQSGVRVCDLGLPGRTPEKVRVRAAGQTLVRIDAGADTHRCGPLTAEARTALRAFRPLVSNVSPESLLTAAPAAFRTWAKRSASGVATKTRPPAVSSSSLPARTRRPWSMITTRSAICWTSDRAWLETSIVRPSPASRFRKPRSQAMPAGSSPLAGSSSTSTPGSPRSAVARPRRCRMPSE